MKKLNQKKFYNKLDFWTLDSFGILLEGLEDNSSYRSVYKEKYNEIADELEGLNEYDIICTFQNFDIDFIKNNRELFSDEEIEYTLNLVKNYINNSSNRLSYMIISKLKDFLNSFDELSVNELGKFFMKYSLDELKVFDVIYEYIKDEELQKTSIIKNMIQELKEQYQDYNKKITNTITNTNELNDKELKFLYKLIEEANNYLRSIQDYQDEYEVNIEEFDINDYPIDKMSKLEEIISYEINNRNSKKKIKKQ